jgi:DNA adenine methylase
MRTTTRKLRPATKWHGGKWYLARRIIGLFDPHRVYVEPFAGGLSVLLNKPRAPVEIASDLDAGLIGFYRALADPTFREELRALPYNVETFNAAAVWVESSNPRVRATGVIVRHQFSRGGLGRSFAWSDRLRGGEPGDRHAWRTKLAELDALAGRLRGVRLLVAPAVEVIRQHDGPDTLLYLDPPYVPSTRTARSAYRHEMTVEQHVELLDALAAVRGSVVLSGYHSPLYDDALATWDRVERNMPNHSGQGRTKQRRVECLWIKQATTRATQGVLF